MRFYFYLFCFFTIVGCSSDRDDFKNKTADKLYSKALVMLRDKDYSDAASTFREIETFFPYSSKASSGQILSSYCHFLAAKYKDAIRELDIFLRYHSSHELVPYAMYLKAMCIYMQVSNIGREADTAHEAKRAFVELVNRFPGSVYQNDSFKRIAIIDDLIAAHEMNIGRYYQKKKSTLSAICRYNFVVNFFGHTEHVVEAYYRMVECCKSEGLEAEAKSTYDVLSKRFPKSKWKAKADLIMVKKKT
jgi:outer membrane protein assembly factor BamD